MAKRKYSSEEIIHKLREADVVQTRGVPEHIRLDNGPEMIAKTLRRWLGRVGARSVYITPGARNRLCQTADRGGTAGPVN